MESFSLQMRPGRGALRRTQRASRLLQIVASFLLSIAYIRDSPRRCRPGPRLTGFADENLTRTWRFPPYFLTGPKPHVACLRQGSRPDGPGWPPGLPDSRRETDVLIQPAYSRRKGCTL